jgi:hypothetical protein
MYDDSRKPWLRGGSADSGGGAAATPSAEATPAGTVRSVAERFMPVQHGGRYECDLDLCTDDAKTDAFIKAYHTRVREMADARDVARWTVLEVDEKSAVLLAMSSTGGGGCFKKTEQKFTIRVEDPSAAKPIVKVEVGQIA